MCKVNGPEALPLRPAGMEKLGQATHNICEQAALYSAKAGEYGRHLPSPKKEMADPTSCVIGRGVTEDLNSYYLRKSRNKKAKKNKKRK